MQVAGRLRHRVTLQRLEQQRNALGEALDTWVPLASVWAEVRDLSGREWYEARQLPEGDVSTTIIIRHRSDVRRTMRVIFGARVFDIVAVLDKDGRGRMLQLMCREVV